MRMFKKYSQPASLFLPLLSFLPQCCAWPTRRTEIFILCVDRYLLVFAGTVSTFTFSGSQSRHAVFYPNDRDIIRHN
jgi:hypothetical protein